MTEEKKKDETIDDQKLQEKKMREIVIATNGDIVNLIKAEVAGKIELIAILESVIIHLRNNTLK